MVEWMIMAKSNNKRQRSCPKSETSPSEDEARYHRDFRPHHVHTQVQNLTFQSTTRTKEVSQTVVVYRCIDMKEYQVDGNKDHDWK